MQAFVLSTNPREAAQMHCDTHVIKILSETAQILCTVASLDGQHAPLAPTHAAHPITVWAWTSHSARRWLFEYGMALCEEYRYRYSREHVYEDIFLSARFGRAIAPVRLRYPMPRRFVLAMSEEYRHGDNKTVTPSVATRAYRNYYSTAKAHLLRYTVRKPPEWLLQRLEGMRLPLPLYRATTDDDYDDVYADA